MLEIYITSGNPCASSEPLLLSRNRANFLSLLLYIPIYLVEFGDICVPRFDPINKSLTMNINVIS